MQAGTYFSRQASNAWENAIFHPLEQRMAQPTVLNYGSADRKLFDAVNYASEDDFVALMHAALAEGASLDTCNEQNQSLLDIAVSRNSTRIVRALVAQGTPLPFPDPSGFDVLMQAAVASNVQIMELLMDAYQLLPDAKDNGGWTALHYAAMSSSPAALEALLQRDLECNDPATGTDHNPLCQIFRDKYRLPDLSLTPLNIAVVSGHVGSVQALLEHGAQVLPGDSSPIRTAIQCRDPATLATLLEHCKRSGNLAAVLDRTMLEACLRDGDHTAMLRLLLEYHRAHPVTALDLDDALSTTIALEHTHQLALLLGEGARLDASQRFYWSLACTAKDRHIHALLTASCDTAFEVLMMKPRDGAPARLLIELPEMISDTAALSSNGIFFTLLPDARPALANLAREGMSLSRAQIAAETAHCLLRFLLPPTQTGSDTSGQESDLLEALALAAEHQRERAVMPPALVTKIPQVMAERHSRITDLAQSQIDALHGALTHCVSAEFLSDIRGVADEGGVVPAMDYQLREVAGMPDELIRLIIDTWTEAEDLVFNESTSSTAPDATAVSRLMATTLFCKLDQIKIDFSHYRTLPLSLLHDCTKKLSTELAAQRQQWGMLIEHPANFLRKLEGRTGLRPVSVPSLTRAIVNATGLPMGLCTAMTRCWTRAVEEASGMADSGSVPQRFQQVDKAFAGYWQDWLEEHLADAETVLLPFTPREVLDSRDWCVRTREAAAVKTASEESRKRKAGGEPEGAPPNKPPRIQ